MKTITAIQLNTLINSAEETPLLLDVREANEFEHCHIAGSQLMPMRSIPDHLNELPKDDAIITICHHGVRSQQVAQYLIQQGFSNVTNLTGGVNAWAHEVDNTMPTY